MSIRPLYVLVFATFLFGCAQVYEVTPNLPDQFSSIPLNGGRTQAVSVDPNNRRNVIIATESRSTPQGSLA